MTKLIWIEKFCGYCNDHSTVFFSLWHAVCWNETRHANAARLQQHSWCMDARAPPLLCSSPYRCQDASQNMFFYWMKYTYFGVTLTQYPSIRIPFIPQTRTRFFFLNPCKLTCCLLFWSTNSSIRSWIASKSSALHFLTTRSTVFETLATLSKSFPVKNLRIHWFNSPGIDYPSDKKIGTESACPSLSWGLSSSTSK